jgi:hypothetical protein
MNNNEQDEQVIRQEMIIDPTTALSLPIEDADLVSVISEKINLYTQEMKKKKIEERRKENRDFWKVTNLTYLN